MIFIVFTYIRNVDISILQVRHLDFGFNSVFISKKSPTVFFGGVMPP